jgi:hypothetical protein
VGLSYIICLNEYRLCRFLTACVKIVEKLLPLCYHNYKQGGFILQCKYDMKSYISGG